MTSGTWIEHYLANRPLRAKSVVMTLFGDSINPRGGKIWLGSLIELLAPFGINDRLVRTSVFRLAEEGWLDASREGRRSRYALTASGLRRFERAYKRIYSPPDVRWAGAWTLLFAPSGMLNAEQRANLRKELLWEGFGMIAPGAFAHPGSKEEVLEELLDRVGVSGKVFVSTAVESTRITSRPLSDLIAHCWELAPVVEGYRHFVDSFGALPKLIKAKPPLTSEQAFLIRTLLIHEFRRVQLLDPQIPYDLLPDERAGVVAAYKLCHQIYLLVYKKAEKYLSATLQREDPDAPEAADYFYERFGGLA